MSKIKIHDIQPTGSDLFDDAESFIGDLQDDEFEQTIGGSMISPRPRALTDPLPPPSTPA